MPGPSADQYDQKKKKKSNFEYGGPTGGGESTPSWTSNFAPYFWPALGGIGLLGGGASAIAALKHFGKWKQTKDYISNIPGMNTIGNSLYTAGGKMWDAAKGLGSTTMDVVGKNTPKFIAGAGNFVADKTKALANRMNLSNKAGNFFDTLEHGYNAFTGIADKAIGIGDSLEGLGNSILTDPDEKGAVGPGATTFREKNRPTSQQVDTGLGGLTNALIQPIVTNKAYGGQVPRYSYGGGAAKLAGGALLAGGGGTAAFLPRRKGEGKLMRGIRAGLGGLGMGGGLLLGGSGVSDMVDQYRQNAELQAAAEQEQAALQAVKNQEARAARLAKYKQEKGGGSGREADAWKAWSKTKGDYGEKVWKSLPPAERAEMLRGHLAGATGSSNFEGLDSDHIRQLALWHNFAPGVGNADVLDISQFKSLDPNRPGAGVVNPTEAYGGSVPRYDWGGAKAAMSSYAKDRKYGLKADLPWALAGGLSAGLGGAVMSRENLLAKILGGSALGIGGIGLGLNTAHAIANMRQRYKHLQALKAQNPDVEALEEAIPTPTPSEVPTDVAMNAEACGGEVPRDEVPSYGYGGGLAELGAGTVSGLAGAYLLKKGLSSYDPLASRLGKGASGILGGIAGAAGASLMGLGLYDLYQAYQEATNPKEKEVIRQAIEQKQAEQIKAEVPLEELEGAGGGSDQGIPQSTVLPNAEENAQDGVGAALIPGTKSEMQEIANPAESNVIPGSEGGDTLGSGEKMQDALIKAHLSRGGDPSAIPQLVDKARELADKNGNNLAWGGEIPRYAMGGSAVPGYAWGLGNAAKRAWRWFRGPKPGQEVAQTTAANQINNAAGNQVQPAAQNNNTAAVQAQQAAESGYAGVQGQRTGYGPLDYIRATTQALTTPGVKETLGGAATGYSDYLSGAPSQYQGEGPAWHPRNILGNVGNFAGRLGGLAGLGGAALTLGSGPALALGAGALGLYGLGRPLGNLTGALGSGLGEGLGWLWNKGAEYAPKVWDKAKEVLGPIHNGLSGALENDQPETNAVAPLPPGAAQPAAQPAAQQSPGIFQRMGNAVSNYFLPQKQASAWGKETPQFMTSQYAPEQGEFGRVGTGTERGNSMMAGVPLGKHTATFDPNKSTIPNGMFSGKTVMGRPVNNIPKGPFWPTAPGRDTGYVPLSYRGADSAGGNVGLAPPTGGAYFPTYGTNQRMNSYSPPRSTVGNMSTQNMSLDSLDDGTQFNDPGSGFGKSFPNPQPTNQQQAGTQQPSAQTNANVSSSVSQQPIQSAQSATPNAGFQTSALSQTSLLPNDAYGGYVPRYDFGGRREGVNRQTNDLNRAVMGAIGGGALGAFGGNYYANKQYMDLLKKNRYDVLQSDKLANAGPDWFGPTVGFGLPAALVGGLLTS